MRATAPSPLACIFIRLCGPVVLFCASIVVAEEELGVEYGTFAISLVASYVHNYEFQLTPLAPIEQAAGNRNWSTGVTPNSRVACDESPLIADGQTRGRHDRSLSTTRERRLGVHRSLCHQPRHRSPPEPRAMCSTT